jgi:hypothetical protein
LSETIDTAIQHIQLDEEQTIASEPDTAVHLPPQYDELMSERSVFCLKSALRLERRDEQANRATQRQNSAIIVANVRRFAHVINTDGVLSTDNVRPRSNPAQLSAIAASNVRFTTTCSEKRSGKMATLTKVSLTQLDGERELHATSHRGARAMKTLSRIGLVLSVAFSVGDCSNLVPDLPPDFALPMQEILLQTACELQYAFRVLDAPQYEKFRAKKWLIAITLQPKVDTDLALGLGGTRRVPTTPNAIRVAN